MKFIKEKSINSDVKELIKLITEFEIVSIEQAKAFLINARDVKDENVDKLIAYVKTIFPYDEQYLKVNQQVKMDKLKNFHFEYIWLAIEHYKSYDYLNSNCKLPVGIYLCDEELKNSLSIFAIRSLNPAFDCNLIDVNFPSKTDECKVLILVEDFTYLDEIVLSESFKILNYCTVNVDGNIEYYYQTN